MIVYYRWEESTAESLEIVAIGVTAIEVREIGGTAIEVTTM